MTVQLLLALIPTEPEPTVEHVFTPTVVGMNTRVLFIIPWAIKNSF
jgi:hypothetical protein